MCPFRGKHLRGNVSDLAAPVFILVVISVYSVHRGVITCYLCFLSVFVKNAFLVEFGLCSAGLFMYILMHLTSFLPLPVTVITYNCLNPTETRFFGTLYA